MLTIKSGGKSLKTPVKQIPPLTPHRIVIILVGNKMLKTLQQIIFFIYLNMSNFVSRFQGAETKVLSKELCIEIQQLKLSAYNIDDGQGYQILGHIFQSSSEQVTLIAFEQHLGKPSKFFFIIVGILSQSASPSPEVGTPKKLYLFCVLDNFEHNIFHKN